MKTKLLTLIIATCALISCNKSTFNVNVELQNAEGKTIYLKKMFNNEFITLDSAIMQNNMVNFVVEANNPSTHYQISIKDSNPIRFFSENNDVKITGDAKNRDSFNVTASYAQQLVNEYNVEYKKYNQQRRELGEKYRTAAQNNDEATIKKLEAEFDKIEKNINNYQKLFLTKNYNNFVAPYILYTNRYNYELNELEDFVNNFNIKEESEYSKLLDEYIAVLQRVDIGQPYVDFTQETPEGYMMSISELVGKSKLLLIDFWASWCGPCRAENPNVVEVYKEYHEKGFDIIGVSLDMEKVNWIKAIENDGLIWHNISDLKYWNNEGAKLYGISSIPSNVLIDQNGIIIAKNLRGEDLRNKVEEILK
ncbi:MAG: AhpC/TSA family protein [Bacteroidales bacterium]|nr:AhpC/TSA family protein [Bacteroidales bacterium]